MARTYFLYIHLDDYLAQWFIHDHGGKHPVHLTRGSIERVAFSNLFSKCSLMMCHSKLRLTIQVQ